MADKDNDKPKTSGTLSVGGTLSVKPGSGSSGSKGSGVAVEVRRRRVSSTERKTASSNLEGADGEMKRRMQALEKAKKNQELEEKKREEEKKRNEGLRNLKRKEEEDRRHKEEEEARRRVEMEAKKAEEELKKQQEEEERQLRAEAEARAVKEAAARKKDEGGRKTLTLDEGFKGKKSKGDKRRGGRNAYLEELEQRQRFRTPMQRRRDKQRGGDSGGSQTSEKISREVTIPEFITVQELASRMSEKGSDVVKLLMGMGQMVTLTQTIDQETAALIVEEMGHTYKLVSESDVEESLTGEEDTPESLVLRPPVVTVMGHVDHGKTTLLDALRKTDVAEGEAGGITQHIGAYQIKTKTGKHITFLDTPGHEAFTSMRARGAQVTDIVILVVAADDGIMPQTVEAIKHAKAAEVPIIVAVNKCDKPEADPERAKQELLNHDLIPEEYGGDTVCVNVSAKAGTGLEELEEMVLLQADMMDLKANPNRRAEGVVVESRLDKGRGPVATAIVSRGTLKTGDIFVAGSVWGRVRALLDDHGQKVEDATPATPVEILGLQGVPEAGDTFIVTGDDKKAREVAEYRERKKREEIAARRSKISLDNLFEHIAAGEVQELPIVVKADVQGSVEAIADALNKLETKEVKVRVLHAAVGVITESDVMLATASNALIMGFNVRADAQARRVSEHEGVEIRYYSVIYNLIDDVKAAMTGLLSPDYIEEERGTAEVREIFKIGKNKIAGCYVTNGKILRDAKARVIRDGVVLHDGELSTLRRFKDDVKEVAESYECGLTFESFDDLREGDLVECYEIVEVKKSLEDVKKAEEQAEKAKASEPEKESA